MARGSYIHEPSRALTTEVHTNIPARATRKLQKASTEEINTKIASTAVKSLIGDSGIIPALVSSQSLHCIHSIKPAKLLAQAHHKHLRQWIICVIGTICFLSILLSAAINLRPQGPKLLSSQALRTYSIQVGGDLANSWQQNQPIASKNSINLGSGSYSVLGQPSISVDFINQVLAAYHSPAAGKGQALYDLGINYGIDPAFAMAFFMHESSFGTKGEAANSLSLGNLRCIPNFRCQDNFTWFDSWEDGFKAWYALIRNLYVAQWGFSTVDQIIPKYAPAADHNNEDAYIAAIKHAIDTWHANTIFVS